MIWRNAGNMHGKDGRVGRSVIRGEARRAPPPRPSPSLRNPTDTTPPRGAPRLTNWLLRHTCFCSPWSRQLRRLSPLGRLSRFSELRVASGFAVRAITTGASIGSRDWERIPSLVHAFHSLYLSLSLPLTPYYSVYPMSLCLRRSFPQPFPLIRLWATGLNLWDNKECGA